ncbi:PREDICTED: ATP-dependent DNA helicase PIF4-like [Erythranthe guttata]|uniref:ATP-dependent DNA helicase PIF4-like n=1 Tax=Erythranthe guttata TaxID=4155 RepID=UPI00064DFFF9|nr:PREDICTED: ATP-dependent DNA helicase PIF4-like [Erythranthe guttata]|eukprot:XP_012839912.1 PREDICTED: ATP-dependent DNA helicase PIF4-like [Erythranthe guttata]
MGKELQRCLASIIEEQRKVYDVVMDDVSNDRGGIFFLHGHGGTGKTFLWKILSGVVRSEGEIVINVASSGIASLFLPGGRTTHSRFGLPINVHETSICSITQQSPHAELLIKAKLIIWDKAAMMHIDCFEALEKTMKSILHVEKLFGVGKVVVPGGDLRQILSVVFKASRQDIVHATIPADMLIGDSEDAFRDLLNFVYPDLLSNIYDPTYFQGRAILAPTNECVESVNDHLMSLLLGEEKLYLSSDSMCRDDQTTEDNVESIRLNSSTQ